MTALLTVAEVAQMLKVSRSWVYENVEEIPHVRLGRSVRFRPEDIETYIADKAGVHNSVNGSLRPSGRRRS